MDLGITDDRECAGREQAAQIAIALLADTAEPVLAAARVLLRHEPDPGREVPTRSEGLRVGNTGDQSSGQCRADARDLIEPFARLIGSVPGHDLAVKFEDLGFQHPQLNSESGNTTTGSGTSSLLEAAAMSSSSATPRRPTGATTPNSARWARIALITAVCCRIKRWRVRCSIRQLCCSGVLVATNRMLALLTASQIASASAASFFCRLT